MVVSKAFFKRKRKKKIETTATAAATTTTTQYLQKRYNVNDNTVLLWCIVRNICAKKYMFIISLRQFLYSLAILLHMQVISKFFFWKTISTCYLWFLTSYSTFPSIKTLLLFVEIYMHPYRFKLCIRQIWWKLIAIILWQLHNSWCMVLILI